jgi:cytochrome P450
MTVASERVDVFAPSLIDDPYAWYAQVLEAGYAEYTPPGRDVTVRVLSRYADVQAVLRDSRFGRATFRAALQNGLGDGPLARVYRDWFLFQDPPDHTRCGPWSASRSRRARSRPCGPGSPIWSRACWTRLIHTAST